uniref:CCHC-type domain-containing protein n=1 Tax=Anopheles christyi TaxID=43041 RepID=A0A182KCZ9_9DIPT
MRGSSDIFFFITWQVKLTIYCVIKLLQNDHGSWHYEKWTWNFGQYLPTAQRNQLVFGLKRNDIRNRLLEKRTLTSEEARDIAVGMEFSKKSSAVIENGGSSQDVQAVQKRNNEHNLKEAKVNKGQHKNVTCYRCGDAKHVANKCKHINTVCSFCRKKGHLAKVCL